MRSSIRLAAAVWLAVSLMLLGGCPSINLPPGESGDGTDTIDHGNGNAGGDDTNGSAGEGGGQTPKITVGLPARSIGYDLIGIHDPGSARYDGNCIGCHGDRTNEVALDGVTPAAHSTMLFRFFGEGNARCVSCHTSAPDFLSYSTGGLRELVNVERDLALESSCTSCHSSGNLAFYVRGF